MTQRLSIYIWSVLFVLFFSGYFGYLSQKLPEGAGPDENAHLSAAQFIYEQGRLPVYPQDAEELYYSIFGATRSFRPPLIYIAAAQIHHLSDALSVKFEQPYRIANSLAGGLTAFFLFLALAVYTHRIGLAVCFTTAFMLMPQIGFLFSYLNADGPAIMACALILLSVCILLKKGCNGLTLAFFGFACGILSLCKVTAWIFCLPVCLFTLIFIIRSPARIVKPFFIIFICFALTAGWRIVFNVQNHGLDNPFNWNLDNEINLRHAVVNLDDVVNYKVQGKSYLDLLTNYDNFLSRTFLSFVGQLDWLRLRVGPAQYMTYALLIAAGLFASLLIVLKTLIKPNGRNSEHYFELSIVAGSVFLFFMYMQFNINNDIQTQGKYVLPAFTGILIILVSFTHRLINYFSSYLFTPLFKKSVMMISLAGLLYIHVQGLYKYVIPFYYTNAYVDTQAAAFTPIPFLNIQSAQTEDLELLQKSNTFVQYKVTGADPKLYIENLNINLEPQLIHLKIKVNNSKSNYYQFYWDSGAGMSEQTVVKGFMPKGENIIYQILPVSSISHLRFDLGTPNSTFTIHAFGYSKLSYKAGIRLLNKLFNVHPGR